MVKWTEKQLRDSYEKYFINCNRTETIHSFEDWKKGILDEVNEEGYFLNE